MPELNSTLFFSLAAGSLVLFLGSRIFFKNTASFTNRIFFLHSIVVACWSLANYFSLISTTDALFWIRAVIFLAVPHVFLFFFFIKSFPSESSGLPQSRFIPLLVLMFTMMSLAFSPLIFESTAIRNGEVVPLPGASMPFFGLTLVVMTLSTIYLIVKRYRESSGVLKKQWFLMGSGFFTSYILLISLVFIGVVVFGTSRFVAYSPIFILPIFIANASAIVRYKLFDVKVITTELFIAGLLLLSFVQILVADSLPKLLISVLVSILVLVIGILLTRSVVNEVSQKEQLQKLTGQLRQANVDLMVRNRYLAALQSLTGEITRSLNFGKFTQDIVDGVATKLGFAGAVLFLVKKEKLEIAAVTKSRLFAKALGYLPQSLFSYSGNLNDNNLTVLAIRTGRIQIGSDLHSFISPPLPKGLSLIMQNALRVRSIMAVPILSENKVLGCLVVAGRATRENTTDNEIQMIKALADEVGIVTRNLTLYEQLEEANTRLVHANDELSRLDKAKTEFLSIASHQLRTPLTAIKGYMSMILDKDYGPYPEKMETPFKDVFESAQRLIALVNDLLDVSRIASGRLELHIQAVDIFKLTGSVIDEIRPKASNKGIDLVVENKISPNTFVKADEEKLRQVVINLVDNAIKYTPKGRVVVRIESNGPKLKYSVIDSGIGLTADEIPQLFHRFMRTPEAVLVETEGTGLGLYVAKTIIEALEGNIRVESAGLGKGSSFIFELPEAKPGFTGGEVIKVKPRENAA